jgi:hypothetical protein
VYTSFTTRAGGYSKWIHPARAEIREVEPIASPPRHGASIVLRNADHHRSDTVQIASARSRVSFLT